MKAGDLVRPIDDNPIFGISPGIIIDSGIDMWGEEVVPSGIIVMWSDGEIETLYEDEIEVISES